jgi:hypothetical protein
VLAGWATANWDDLAPELHTLLQWVHSNAQTYMAMATSAVGLGVDFVGVRCKGYLCFELIILLKLERRLRWGNLLFDRQYGN